MGLYSISETIEDMVSCLTYIVPESRNINSFA